MTICDIKKCECGEPIQGDWNSSDIDWFNNHKCKWYFKKYKSYCLMLRADFGYYYFGFSTKYNYYSVYLSKDNIKLETVNPKISFVFDKDKIDHEYFINIANSFIERV